MRRAMHLGVALGEEGITAVLVGASGGREIRVEVPRVDGVTPEGAPTEQGGPGTATRRAARSQDPASKGLKDAFVRLAGALAAAAEAEGIAVSERLRVHIALLPPLCDIRLVALPPLRPGEAETVLRRQAARHFVGRKEPLVVGVVRPGGGWRGEGRSERTSSGSGVGAGDESGGTGVDEGDGRDDRGSDGRDDGRDDGRGDPRGDGHGPTDGPTNGEGNGKPAVGSALAPVLAAAASSALLETLHQATAARGWSLEGIVAAHGAWLEALHLARRTARRAAREDPDGSEPSADIGVGVVVARVDDTLHLMRERDGAVDRVRRLPGDGHLGLLDAVGSLPGQALVLAADVEARAEVETRLRQQGWTVGASSDASRGASADASVAPSAHPPGAATAPEADPRLVAARHASRGAPELVPASLARFRRARSRRLATRLGAAAVVILALTAGVHLWGTGRALQAIQQERAESSEAVAPALAARDSLDRMEARLDELRSLREASAQWTFSLVEMAVLLPPETHLVSLRAAGDTVVLEAAGGRAGETLASLDAAPTLRDVRLEGAIQREIEGGATSRERFTLSAILSGSSRPERPPRGNGGDPAGEGER